MTEAYKIIDHVYDTVVVGAGRSGLRATMGSAEAGLKTAFVLRPTEHGPNQATDTRAEQDWEVVANSFEELADRLGC